MTIQANDPIYAHLLYKILRIRMVEEQIATRYQEEKMRCPVHLSIGQEAIAVMVCENLNETDLVVSTHRAHAHYLAKGGSLRGLVSELYGKITGCTQGRGGSMHLSNLQSGFVASTAIVGNIVPIGVGLAFAEQFKKTNIITCIFLGDAAIEEGVFYESLNFAVLKKLPVIFICENNLYSVNTPLHIRQPANRSISEMVKGMGAKSRCLDGNDSLNNFNLVCDVIKDLRDNGGVWFLEFETYRYKVHCGPEDDRHPERPEAEQNSWFSKDPVHLLKSQLLKSESISNEQVKNWRCEIQKEIDDAFDFAETSSFPLPEHRFDHQYAESRSEWLESMMKLKREELVS
jgi:TPP-dependent pyruvate/acetoin dehydrogenase alpha subunit